uniref:Uncharacterized protein n=1 Tax=Acrobeloides nanus TaxID=290746 RepID=A0A914CAK7_9BILA
MLPPDRNIFKSEPKPPAPELSALEKLVRRLEKDDILLYVTAFFGVFMPALVYLIYRQVHSSYYSYSERQRKEKSAKKIKKKKAAPPNAFTIFYCGTMPKMKQLAYDFAEKLEFLDPLVVNLQEANLAAFASYRGIAIFLIDIAANSTSECQFFIDWLMQVRFELKQRQLLKWMRFSIFNAFEHDTDQEFAQKTLNTLNKSLCGIGALPLCEMKLAKAQDSKEMEMHSIAWIDELCNAIKSSESCLGQNSESSASDSDMSQFSRLDDYDESEMEDSYEETFSKKRI